MLLQEEPEPVPIEVGGSFTIDFRGASIRSSFSRKEPLKTRALIRGWKAGQAAYRVSFPVLASFFLDVAIAKCSRSTGA